MNEHVSSVAESQFVVGADLMLYTKLVPKIGSMLKLRTNAKQHSIARFTAISNIRLNQDEHHVVFYNKYFSIPSNTNKIIQKCSYRFRPQFTIV